MVIWDPTEVAFSLGSFDVRWYGLCWCMGLALAYLVVMKLYQRQQIPPEKFESLFLYCFVGIEYSRFFAAFSRYLKTPEVLETRLDGREVPVPAAAEA